MPKEARPRRRRKARTKRRTVPAEPASHGPRLEVLIGYRKPEGERPDAESASPIFAEEEVDFRGGVMRPFAVDPDLVKNGSSYLGQIAHWCGAEVPDWIKTDVGRARGVLRECDQGHEIYRPKVLPGCFQRCQDAVDYLRVIEAVNGFGQNYVPHLSEENKRVAWLTLELAFAAGRLAGRVEARAAEDAAGAGAFQGEQIKEAREDLERIGAELAPEAKEVGIVAAALRPSGSRDHRKERAISAALRRESPVCVVCGGELPPRRRRYCSETCRQAAPRKAQ